MKEKEKEKRERRKEREREENFFFFKQKTAYEVKECDWSSDVCSSDLPTAIIAATETMRPARRALM